MANRSNRRQTHGRYADPLAATKKLARSPEGQHGQVIAPDPSAVREAIEAGKCPWCGRGPYKVLATHTGRSHGIGASELRELAGLKKRASICDPSHSQSCRELLTERPAWPEMSRKGYEAVAAERVEAANEGRRRQVRRDMAHVDELVGRRFREGVLLRDIATEAGLGIDGVRGALARLGLGGADNRARRAATPQEKTAMSKSAANAREGIKRAAQKRREGLIAEFNELGGTLAVVEELAKCHNVTPKNMRARLVKIGVIPGGRVASGSK